MPAPPMIGPAPRQFPKRNEGSACHERKIVRRTATQACSYAENLGYETWRRYGYRNRIGGVAVGLCRECQLSPRNTGVERPAAGPDFLGRGRRGDHRRLRRDPTTRSVSSPRVTSDLWPSAAPLWSRARTPARRSVRRGGPRGLRSPPRPGARWRPGLRRVHGGRRSGRRNGARHPQRSAARRRRCDRPLAFRSPRSRSTCPAHVQRPGAVLFRIRIPTRRHVYLPRASFAPTVPVGGPASQQKRRHGFGGRPST